MKIKKPSIKFLLLFFIPVIIFTFLSSGLLIFFLNGYFSLNIFNQIAQHYTPFFTYTAIIKGYPRVWESILYSFIFWSAVIGFIAYISKNKKSLHGEARFANKKEIEEMGLLQNKGLIVGKLPSGELLKWKSSEFLALGAPTRSGKGVAIVIPNLMEWEESCVVLDIKQECFDFSSKYRRDILGQEVYLFNPFDFRTHRYNPLTYINLMDDTTRDNSLLDFVNLLYPADGDSTTVFFNQLAQNLFIGLAYLYKDLALTEKGQEFLETNNLKIDWSMAGLLNLSAGFDLIIENEDGEEDSIAGLDNTFEYLEHLELISKPTKEKLNSYFSIDSQNTKSGVMSSFNAPLMIYRNEPITTATAVSDFDLRDLRKKKMTIFIGITPDKLAIARPILNIFFSQLISLNIKELPQSNPDLKYTCLLLMDEFTSIGNMPILKKGVSFIAGYSLRFIMIFQALSQLEDSPPDGYGKEGAKTLTKNMGMFNFYAPREIDDAKSISEMLGYTTFKAVSKSYNHGKLFENGSSSHSVSEQQRALMLPQELLELPFENQVIRMPGRKPILCNKAFYYNDKYFIDKFKMVSNYLKGVSNPSHKDWEVMLQKRETVIDIPINKSISNNI